MSAPTPRTDAAAAITAGGKVAGYTTQVPIELARDLERELAAQSLAAFERIHELKRDNARLRGALTVVANCIGSDQDGTTLGTYEMGVARAALAGGAA